MSPLVLLAIAAGVFVLWHFLPQKEKQTPKPAPRYRKDPRVTTDQAEWQRFIEEHCESPAEVAFLRTMITSLGMRPFLGALISDGVRLDLQVEEGRYRVDFLINHWLVVEIDGAAYHSSAEAKARDQLRDHYFEGLGYTVLRIPAKVALQTPSRAIDEVQSALKVGKREIETPSPDAEPSTGLARLARTISALGTVDEMASKRRVVARAVVANELAVKAEEEVLAAAFQLAKERIEHALWLEGVSDDVRACYEQSVADLKAAAVVARQAPIQATHSRFERPALTGDEWVDARISESFDMQVSSRIAMFESARGRLASDGVGRSHMRDALTDLGRDDLWAHVS